MPVSPIASPRGQRHLVRRTIGPKSFHDEAHSRKHSTANIEEPTLLSLTPSIQFKRRQAETAQNSSSKVRAEEFSTVK